MCVAGATAMHDARGVVAFSTADRNVTSGCVRWPSWHHVVERTLATAPLQYVIEVPLDTVRPGVRKWSMRQKSEKNPNKPMKQSKKTPKYWGAKRTRAESTHTSTYLVMICCANKRVAGFVVRVYALCRPPVHVL